MRLRLILILILFTTLKLKAQDTLLLNKLSEFIGEFEKEGNLEDSKTWGISFEIPIMIATSDFVITNRPVDSFIRYKNIFFGKTNEIKPGGHSRKNWKGIDWGFYTYPDKAFENKNERLSLFFHEAFHRNQPFIGLDGIWTQCSHLTNSDARSLLKLEYNALLKSLNDSEYKTDLIDALTFRAYRYYLYPNAYNEEQAIEILEGLAEYTGLKLSGYTKDEIFKILKQQMSYNPQLFAYFSGAIYGFVLDIADTTWRKNIKQNDNFLYFVQKRLELKLPMNLKLHIESVRNKYGWDTISITEIAINKQIKKQEKFYTEIFFKKPVIKIPMNLCKGGYRFKSSIIFPLANGKVYNGFSTSGDWGELSAKDEIFFSVNILLPTPFEKKEKLVIGKGWQIKLSDNWTIKQTSKDFYELVQDK